LKKLTVVQRVTILSILMEPEVHYLTHKSLPLVRSCRADISINLFLCCSCAKVSAGVQHLNTTVSGREWSTACCRQGIRAGAGTSWRTYRVIQKEVYTLKKLFYKNYWR
jgi:hypothetical protein